MTIRTRIEPISDVINMFVQEMAPAEQRKAIAEFARERLAEAQQTNRASLGRVPPHTTHVDGRENAALESVRPDGGVIVFEFELIETVLKFVATALIETSPELSGEYKRSHIQLVDNAQVPMGTVVPGADTYMFTNFVEYARKIEVGHMKMRVPGTDAVYDQVQRATNQRFGNLVKTRRTFITSPGGYTLKGKFQKGHKPQARTGLKADTIAGKAVTYPALILTLR